MGKSRCESSEKAGKKSAVLTSVLTSVLTAAKTAAKTAACAALCAVLTACGAEYSGRPDGRGTEVPEPTKAVVTAAPSGAQTGAPQPTATQSATRGPELPVSPLPQTPEDPFDPASYPALDADTQAKLKKLLNYYGTSFESVYNAINNRNPRRPYFYYDYDDALDTLPGYDALARYILEKGHGVCYHYAALTYYLLREAGYNACIIHGYREIDTALHYWTMVETEYGWYHFDPLHRQMLLTDAQKSSDFFTDGNGLTWQAGIWPRSATRPYPG